ncbi:MAG: T1SS secreted agglutinin RTX [Candidatus Ozemobacter sibiricus]|uniref:T1SS secreted agglutinin RTX n=1 Tax=Candidatus Ozemobacter sibiricus TaxID=2268124 RepID=A0A367ZPU0_9BACT|nr:MAG: T1SS secreted agglutinin RTX [Candidatus Ozemobacter sibiricus]
MSRRCATGHRSVRILGLALGVILLASTLQAAITNPTCTITTPTDLAKRYNNAQTVTLAASWQGDTPPFAATFKAGGVAIGTANTNGTTANFAISASGLPGESVTFSVSIIETAVVNAPPSPDTPAPGTLLLDRTAPRLELRVTSGAVVSPQTGFNTVTLAFTSDEPLAGPPVFTISPGSWGNPTPASPEAPPYSSNQYTITVPAGTPAGVYTVQVQGFDNTEPASGRNSSTAQTAFQVDAGADGAPVILSCSPRSPFRTESLTLSGSVPAESGAQRVEILEGGSVVATVNVPANTDTWTATISGIAEGNHSYTARRIDPLGNTSPSSAEFPVVADRTPPHEPVLEPLKKPVNTKRVTVRGTAVTDPPHHSGPLKVTLFSGATQLATTNANADGTFAFTDVEMPSTGQNQLVARAADTTWDGTGSKGNESPYSNLITVIVDQEAPYVVSGGISISRPDTGPPVLRSVVGPGPAEPVRAVPPVVARPPESVRAIPPAGKGTPGVGESSSPVGVGSIEGAFPGPAADGAGPAPVALLAGAPEGFVPPPGGWSAGLVPVSLPCALVRDRSPARVRFWVAFRKAGQRRGLMYLVPMTLSGDRFTGFLPNDPLPLFYRFRLLDAAGNESFFPADGEFCRGVQPADTLRLLHRPRWYEAVPATDEWPVDVLGLPPLARVLAYRRLLAPADLVEPVKTWLSTWPEAAGIEVVEAGPTGEAAAREAPWRRDLELLAEERLPVERLEVLIPEVVNGDVPLSELPDPERLPSGPAWERLRNAIRFRQLHAPAP